MGWRVEGVLVNVVVYFVIILKTSKCKVAFFFTHGLNTEGYDYIWSISGDGRAPSEDLLWFSFWAEIIWMM